MAAGSAGAAVGAARLVQQGFQFLQVGSSQGLVASQLVQCEPVFVGAQEHLGFGAKAVKVHRTGHQGQIDFGGLADGVFKVGVDHFAAAFFDEFDQAAQLAPSAVSLIGTASGRPEIA